MHVFLWLTSTVMLGVQEIDRIMDEVEAIYLSQPTEWLFVAPIGSMVHAMFG